MGDGTRCFLREISLDDGKGHESMSEPGTPPDVVIDQYKNDGIRQAMLQI
jgi:hypothetical protein